MKIGKRCDGFDGLGVNEVGKVSCLNITIRGVLWPFAV